MIQCFAPGCTAAVGSAEHGVQCEKCKFFLCCTSRCLQKHSRAECDALASSVVHKSIGKLFDRIRNYEWATVVRKTMESNILDLTACWTALFLLARTVAGHIAVQNLGRERVADEIALCVPDWNEKGDYRHRETMARACMRLASGEQNEFLPTMAKIVPGENYFLNSPDVKETCSYDHAFAVVPLQRENARNGNGNGNCSEAENENDVSIRSLLVQVNKKNKFTVTVVERSKFWTQVATLVQTRRWTEETTDLYRELFGVNQRYPGRTVFPIVKTGALLATICTVCGRETEPMHCAQCKTAIYCSRECQALDWQDGHRHSCHPVHLIYG